MGDISYQNKNNLEFKGILYDRVRIQMKLSSFMTGFTCLEKNIHHWTHDLDMNLFLASEIRSSLTASEIRSKQKEIPMF